MPSANNLRIIHQNLVDLNTTTITASSTAGTTSVANLKSDTKSLVWRSAVGTRASLIVDLGVAKTVGGVVLAFANLPSSGATMRIAGYNTLPTFTGNALTATPTPAFNTGTVLCCPWNNLALPDWGTNPAGSSNYSYGGGTYARVWLSAANSAIAVRYLGIEIQDTTSTSYTEISRLIVGNYWSPTYNTGYGIEAGIKDLSEHVRTEGGDLLTRRGPRYRTLNFDLNWMNAADRKEMTKLLLANGTSKPIFASLFPDSTGDDEDYQREGVHQIYGKLSTAPGISYSNYAIYATSLELEEV